MTTLPRVAVRVSAVPFLLGVLLVSPHAAHAANTHSLLLDASSNQYLTATDTAAVSVTGDFTIETWIKFNSLPSSNQVYSLITKFAGGDDSYALWFYNDNGTLELEGGFASTGSDHTGAFVPWTPSTNTWYHLAEVYDTSGTMRIYVNETLIGTVTDLPTSINDGSLAFMIGQDSASEGAFDGFIDDVRLYNVARSQSDIASDYLTEPTGTESGLVGAWGFDNTLDDATGNTPFDSVNGPSFSTDVHPSASLPGISSFTATPSTILTGATTTLSWSVSDATSVVIDTGVGSVATSTGSYDAAPTVTTTYTLTASNQGLATSTQQVTVTVNEPPAIPYAARKSADESLTTSATLHNDSELAVQLTAGNTYIIDGLVFVTASGATPGLTLGVSAPSGTNAMMGYIPVATSSGIISTLNTASSRIDVGTGVTMVAIHGTVVAPTAGVLHLQWAQATSDAASVTVKKGSYLRVAQL